MGRCDAPAHGRTKPPHQADAKRETERWIRRRIMDRRQRDPTDQSDRLEVGYWIVPGKSLRGWLAGNRHPHPAACKHPAVRRRLPICLPPDATAGKFLFATFFFGKRFPWTGISRLCRVRSFTGESGNSRSMLQTRPSRRPNSRHSPPQRHHTLQMPRVRKQIKRLHGNRLIAAAA